MKLAIILIASLMLAVTVGCGQPAPVDLGDPYTADQLIQARNENASRFNLDWKGKRINVTGVVGPCLMPEIYTWKLATTRTLSR